MRYLSALWLSIGLSTWLSIGCSNAVQQSANPLISNAAAAETNSTQTANATAQTTNPSPGEPVSLTIGDHSTRWYRFVEGLDRDQDPAGIIQIQDGVVHMYADAVANTVQPYAYLCTDAEFENYNLKLEFRWGNKKFEPRVELPRDAGILFHVVGQEGLVGIWPRSNELQIQEGDTGDTTTVGIQVRTASVTGEEPIFSDSANVKEITVGMPKWLAQVRKSAMHEIDGWNEVELRVRGDSAEYRVNGKVVNRCWGMEQPDPTDPDKWRPLCRGRILLQAEGAEVEYRKIEIQQVADSEPIARRPAPKTLRVGAATGSFVADDKMQIAGGIGPSYSQGQEGDLRAVAVVLEVPGSGKVAIVGCDVLFVTREMIGRATSVIEKSCGIPSSHVLVNATHTHHAPSTVRVHGCEPQEEFIRSVENGIVQAVEMANSRLQDDCKFSFLLNPDVGIGNNSRFLLSDKMISWVGDTRDAIRATGPFDPELCVLAFRNHADRPIGAIFNHSTHTIGTRGGAVRSPSFYGLSAQEMEKDWGAPICFLEGASGSTHNYTHTVNDAITKLNSVLKEGLEHGKSRSANRVASIRKPFEFRVRAFDEAVEDNKVIDYCSKREPALLQICTDVFRQMRKELEPQQNQKRETWLQVMCIGDVAIVGVPAEFFTVFGLEIKKRSPFKETYIAELANDWIGYLPDREAHDLGGYQTWMGLHCYAEVGTGERVVDEIVDMLRELAKPQ